MTKSNIKAGVKNTERWENRAAEFNEIKFPMLWTFDGKERVYANCIEPLSYE